MNAAVLLSVGEVNTNKNHATIIRTLAKLKKENLYYVICGNGPLMEKEKQLANHLNVGKHVIFAGYRKDVSDFYQMADVFAFPSYREGLSAALMEAMTSEMPVICSDIRGNNDLIDNCKGGYRLSPSSVEQWADAIKKMFQEKDQWSQYGEYNRNKIANAFSQKLALKMMRQIYSEYSKI